MRQRGADADAPLGSRIDLVVSKGPTPVPVEKVIGLQQGEAVAVLESQGFVVEVQEEFSDRVDMGAVISQAPAKNADLQPGETVTIVVSKGPRSSRCRTSWGWGGTRRSRGSGASACWWTSPSCRGTAARTSCSRSRRAAPRSAPATSSTSTWREGRRPSAERAPHRDPARARDGRRGRAVFISNPRAWSGLRLETAQAFGAEWREAAIGPLFVHAPYLVNIASPNPEFLAKSVELCRRSVAACGVLEAGGFVVHSGAGGEAEVADALDRSATVLQATLAETPDETQLLVELMAGTSGAVASTLGRRTLFDAVDDDRLGLVLDTCHLFATGYALDEPKGVEALFAELQARAGRRLLADPHERREVRTRLQARPARDRRRGAGSASGFRAIVTQPEVHDLSVVVETRHRANVGASSSRRSARSRPDPARRIVARWTRRR